MIDLVALGTIGLDTVRTPFGESKEALGGTGVYFSLGASFFAKTGLISVIGTDFPTNRLEFLERRGVCLKGVKTLKKPSFRWKAYYEYDMNEAHTLETHTQILEDFEPEIPEEYKNTKYVFLGNIDPELQIKVLKSMENPEFLVLDTMNYWIKSKKEKLIKAIEMVDMLVLNEWEARELFETPNLVRAAKEGLKLGPKYIVIKKGEHGAVLFAKDWCFFVPGYPLEIVKDPTGAGDSFAGGMLGWLGMKKELSKRCIKKALVYGSVIASFNAEDFSIYRLKNITIKDIEKRYKEFKKLVHF